MRNDCNEIKMYDLGGQYMTIEQDLADAVNRVMRSGRYILGEQVALFEKELAEYLGARYAVALASGTDALLISLKALGIGEGDEVITTPFSFVSTASAIIHAGARPVFSGIREEDFTLDPATITSCLSLRTRAIMPVHIFGCPARMDEIMEIADEHGLAVVEDCAQALGACINGKKVGTIGRAGAFSFYPTKPLGGYGDGGLMVTDDEVVAGRARMLRDHGARAGHDHVMLGYNSRLDEIQAAALRVKLDYLDGWNSARIRLAGAYERELSGSALVLPGERPANMNVYSAFTVRSQRRDALRTHLAGMGIETAVYYPKPLQAHKPIKAVALCGLDAGVVERICSEVLSLPIHALMDEADVRVVAEAIMDWESKVL